MKKTPFILTGIILVFIFSAIQAQPGFKAQKERIYMPLKDSICEFYPETVGDVCRNKLLFEYNEFGKIVSESSHYLDYTNIWSISKTEYQYDYEGNVTEMITNYKDEQLGWIPYMKQINIYNENNQILESVLYYNLSEQGTSWGVNKKNIYKYNLNNEKIGTEVFFWNQEWNEWKNFIYEQYFYNSENQMYLYRYNLWNENNEEYVFSNQTRYEFAEGDKISGTTEERWDSDERTWLNFRKSKYNYVGDSLKSIIYERWDSDSLFWINHWKYAYTYDTNFNILIDSTCFWRNYLQDWDYYKKGRNYYSLHVVDVVTIQEPVFSNLFIFPNPTNDVINIANSELYEFTAINIYNESCQLISKQKFKKTINMNFVSRGIYFIELLGTKGNWTKKIIVE